MKMCVKNLGGKLRLVREVVVMRVVIIILCFSSDFLLGIVNFLVC